MNNLLKETKEKLAEHGKSWKDVHYVSVYDNFSEQKAISIPVFKKVINRNYDDGYGHPEVNESLEIVGDDWWLERHEYDGSEWWEYKTKPVRPESIVTAIDTARELIWE